MPDEPKRKDPGPALDWDEATIEKMAEVGPEDAEEAGAFWSSHADDRHKRLLDAEPESEEDQPE
jgi:hypothetical protein